MTKKKSKTHLLIDGDMLVYTIGFASEKKGLFADGSTYKYGDLALAKALINRKVKSFLEQFNTDNYTLVLTGKGNYRTEFYPEYKANRVGMVKPVCYTEIRDWLSTRKDVIIINGEEADDWLAAKASAHPDCIIISADKDFYTVPGYTFNITAQRLFCPSISQALCFLLFQALSGDRVDGYFGVKWLGVAKSKKLMQACHKKTFRQAYLLIKRTVIKRNRDAWKDFRMCLDLAAIRWDGEIGQKGIGLRRIFKYRNTLCSYFLPYYLMEHNIKFGKPVGDIYQK